MSDSKLLAEIIFTGSEDEIAVGKEVVAGNDYRKSNLRRRRLLFDRH